MAVILAPGLGAGPIAPPSALVLLGTPPAAVAGQPYSWTPLAAGGQPPYSFSVQGAPAAGLSLDPRTGAIFGTPTTVETLNGVFVTVTDAAGATATRQWAETVTAPNPPAAPTALAYDAAAITGLGQPGAEVAITIDASALFGAALVQPDATWRHALDAPLSPYLAHTITATQTAFGLTSPASATLSLAATATPPLAFVAPPPLGGPSGTPPPPSGAAPAQANAVTFGGVPLTFGGVAVVYP